MKSLLVLLLVLSSAFSHAEEFRFSAYSCHFQRIVKDNMWFPPMMGYLDYDSVLGWNQVNHITKSGSNMGGSELGICGNIHSTVPDYINLTIHYVVGSEIAMTGDSCEYQGKNIAFESVSKEVSTVNDYLIAKKTVTTEYGDVEYVTVVGIRETHEDFPRELCMKAFEEATGTKFTTSLKSSPIKTKFKKIEGQVLN